MYAQPEVRTSRPICIYKFPQTLLTTIFLCTFATFHEKRLQDSYQTSLLFREKSIWINVPGSTRPRKTFLQNVTKLPWLVATTVCPLCRPLNHCQCRNRTSIPLECQCLQSENLVNRFFNQFLKLNACENWKTLLLNLYALLKQDAFWTRLISPVPSQPMCREPAQLHCLDAVPARRSTKNYFIILSRVFVCSNSPTC